MSSSAKAYDPVTPGCGVGRNKNPEIRWVLDAPPSRSMTIQFCRGGYKAASRWLPSLARRHVGVPPRADVGGAQIIAVHHIDRFAAAGLCGAHAQIAR